MAQKFPQSLLARCRQEESGQDAIEFALLLGFFAFAVGGLLPAAFGRLATELQLLVR